MPNAVELLQSHFDTLVRDRARWQTLIADDLVWELPYAPSIGHPPKLAGREQIVSFVKEILNATEDFHFHDIDISVMVDENKAVAQVQATARIVQTGRYYNQRYVVFLQSRQGKIAHIREYFNPATAAFAMGLPILELAAL